MAPSDARPTVFLIAGPNGAGKTTFFYTAIAPKFTLPFINADEIQADAERSGDAIDAYEAARRANHLRNRLLRAGRSFATETVFSHPSKLEFLETAKAHGFRVVAFHIDVERADISVARVRHRVDEGGHGVAEEKIRTRYDRNKPLIRRAVLMADNGSVWDGSRLNLPPRLLLRFSLGRLLHAEATLPEWCRQLYRADTVSG